MTETRPLSYIEKFATGWMSPVGHLRFSGPFTEDLIIEAMKQVRWRNPLLRCIIQEACILTQSAESSLSQPLPIVLHKSEGSEDQRFEEAAFCAYHRMGLNMVPRNLWHMTFFYDDQGCDMIIQRHHSILDGLSLFSIAKDFLMACEGDVLEIRPLNLALESICPEHAKAIQGREPFAVKEWLDIMDIQPKSQPIFTGSVLTRLSQDQLLALKLRARSYGLTLHAAFMAAYLFATDNELPKLYCDVSMRSYCQPRLDSIAPGVYNAQAIWPAQVDKEKSFWENAALLLKEMRDLLASGGHLYSNPECSSASTGPQVTCITNMFPLEMPRKKFAIEFSSSELVTGLSSDLPSFPVIFSIVTINGIANLRLHYHQHFWSCDKAEQVLQKIVEILVKESMDMDIEEVHIFSQPKNQWIQKR